MENTVSKSGKAKSSKWDGKPSFRLDVTELASFYRNQLAASTRSTVKPKLIAFLANDDPSALSYARATGNACTKDGIDFELRQVDQQDLESAVDNANKDPQVHGMLIYYPVFGDRASVNGSNVASMVGSLEKCPSCFFLGYCTNLSCFNFSPCSVHETCLKDDNYLRDCIVPEKDVEGLCHRYRHSLFHNVRFLGEAKKNKCIVPCTPLACVKILEHLDVYDVSLAQGDQLEGKVVTIINRSQIMGHPLAAMLANDGATVYSVDIDSIFILRRDKSAETSETIESACRQSNVIVLGWSEEQQNSR